MDLFPIETNRNHYLAFCLPLNTNNVVFRHDELEQFYTFPLEQGQPPEASVPKQ